MAKGFMAWVLTLLVLGTLAAGCDIFSPQSSKSTIEVSLTDTRGVCGLTANLDGGANQGVGEGSYVSFPPVNPGSHTVNLSSSTGGSGCSGGAPCVFQNSTVNFSETFTTSGGTLYVVKVAAGAACPNLVVSGP